MTRRPPPTLRALTVTVRGKPHRNTVYCPWCEEIHTHGLSPGSRAPHCTREDSPLIQTGYSLDIQGETKSSIAVAPDVARRQSRYLHQSLDQASGALRNTALRIVLGRKFGTSFAEGRVGPAIVSVCGDYWQVAPLGLKPGEDLGFGGGPSPRVSGRGLIGLFATLWTLPAGVVAVRLLEAVAFRGLDAEARLEIAAAVDAWVARQGRRRGAP